MQYSWSRKSIQNKWTLDSALNLDINDIRKMKISERAELAQFLQNSVNTRVRSYSRAKKYNHPYAYQKMQENFRELMEISDYQFDFNSPIVEGKGKKRYLSKAYATLAFPSSRIISYIVQARNFLSAKSSTVSGWRQIIHDESMKLFGYKTIHSKRGDYIRLNYLMTEDERAAFWKLYEELKKSGSVTMYDSESMRSTGFTRIWREKQSRGEWNYNDLTSMMNTMLEEMRKSGTPVRDIVEHKPGITQDPTARDDADEEDSDVEFRW